jgi:hypothetical protein
MPKYMQPYINHNLSRWRLWAIEKKEKVVAEKKRACKNRKVIFARAKHYAEEYDIQDGELLPRGGHVCFQRDRVDGLAVH